MLCRFFRGAFHNDPYRLAFLIFMFVVCAFWLVCHNFQSIPNLKIPAGEGTKFLGSTSLLSRRVGRRKPQAHQHKVRWIILSVVDFRQDQARKGLASGSGNQYSLQRFVAYHGFIPLYLGTLDTRSAVLSHVPTAVVVVWIDYQCVFVLVVYG